MTMYLTKETYETNVRKKTNKIQLGLGLTFVKVYLVF